MMKNRSDSPLNVIDLGTNKGKFDSFEALTKKRRYWWQFWLPKQSIADQNVELKQFVTKLSGTPDVFKGKSGRVIKAKHSLEYEPNISTKGGRVVRQIPKQLKKIKEAQSVE